jgi:hypothetical protein
MGSFTSEFQFPNKELLQLGMRSERQMVADTKSISQQSKSSGAHNPNQFRGLGEKVELSLAHLKNISVVQNQ